MKDFRPPGVLFSQHICLRFLDVSPSVGNSRRGPERACVLAAVRWAVLTQQRTAGLRAPQAYCWHKERLCLWSLRFFNPTNVNITGQKRNLLLLLI